MTKHFKLACIGAAVLSAVAVNAHAAGFQLTEQSALGLGRAYAGIGVDGTDLSGIYYNPATMTLHSGTAVQAGLVGVGLNLEYKDDKGGVTENGRKAPEVVPNLYFLHQATDSVWLGLGITAPFGMSTEYNDNWAHNERGISASVTTIDFNPNLAWKLNEKLSFGAGVSIQYAQADLKMAKKAGNLELAQSEIDADSLAWGWNVGVMWTPVENVRLGLSYRSKVKHDAKGDLTVNANTTLIDGILQAHPEMADALGGLKALNGVNPGYATLATPAWVMATAAWDVNDAVSLYGTLRYADWSSFKKLDIQTEMAGHKVTASSVNNQWKDTWLGSVGADWRVTPAWTLRGGIGYETSAIDNPRTRTTIIPDANRWWFTLGTSYKFTDNLQLDASAAHLRGVGDRSVYSGENGSGEKVGEFERLDAYLLGVQMQYRF